MNKNMKEWVLIKIVPDGQKIIINGVNLWEHQWISLDEEPIKVSHSSYPNQEHDMSVYKIISGDKNIVFAAGEFSNCVWGFYIPSV